MNGIYLNENEERHKTFTANRSRCPAFDRQRTGDGRNDTKTRKLDRRFLSRGVSSAHVISGSKRNALLVRGLYRPGDRNDGGPMISSFIKSREKIKRQAICLSFLFRVVPRAGLEPARIAPHAPQTCAATNYATSAISELYKELFICRGFGAGSEVLACRCRSIGIGCRCGRIRVADWSRCVCIHFAGVDVRFRRRIRCALQYRSIAAGQ